MVAGDLIPAARKRFQPPQLVLAQSLGQSQSLNLEQALGGQPEGQDQKQRILSSLKDNLPLDTSAAKCLSPDAQATLSPTRTISVSDLSPVSVVGTGTSGVVQKVLHRPTGRSLVLKVIACDLRSASTRKQVFGELRMLRSCRHANIVCYHESFFDDGAVTIVMEYLNRGSLSDLFTNYKQIPERFLALIVTQVLQGLQYLHTERRILHRDIKPSNLLINACGEVKLSDFGVSGEAVHSMAQCTSWVGTMTYMSPERLQGQPYSYPSDIWAIGLVLAEGALGRFPYSPQKGQAPSFWDLLDRITNQSPLPTLSQDASLELHMFVDSCLHKDPKKRWTATQLLQHPFIRKYDCVRRMASLKRELAAAMESCMVSPRA